MGKVIWHITMSREGFIAGPEHSMEWAFDAFKDAGPNRLGGEVMNETGAILGGRGWYDAALANYDGVDGICGGCWTGPVVVLSHRPQDAPDDPRATFVSGIDEALARARDAAGGKNVEIFGANVGRKCRTLGLSTRSSSTSRRVSSAAGCASRALRRRRGSTSSARCSRSPGA